MPKASRRTLAVGARQLVVQDALEMMWCFWGSYFSWLIPKARVMSGFFAGAEIRTFLAPAARCFSAADFSVNRPVHSSTTSTPRDFHGSAAGSFSAESEIF